MSANYLKKISQLWSKLQPYHNQSHISSRKIKIKFKATKERKPAKPPFGFRSSPTPTNTNPLTSDLLIVSNRNLSLMLRIRQKPLIVFSGNQIYNLFLFPLSQLLLWLLKSFELYPQIPVSEANRDLIYGKPKSLVLC